MRRHKEVSEEARAEDAERLTVTDSAVPKRLEEEEEDVNSRTIEKITSEGVYAR